MPNMLTTTEAAARIGVKPRTVQQQCAAGRVPGAVKHGRDWLVPVAVATPEAWRATVGKPGRKPSQ